MNVLRLIDRWMVKLEEHILSYSIILIAIMVVGNVLSRAITGSSWAFSQEVSRFAVTVATFMGISYAARKGRHISMSAFYDLAPFPIRKALAIFIPALTAVVLFVMSVFAFDYFMSLVASGRVTTAMQVPVYLFAMFVPIGFVLGGIQFLRNMWVNIKEKEVYLAQEKKDYS
ncbi:TRAP transporter small permease [Halalkalibacter akibai]|uniref:TRAP-type transport system n=1 Tax=Halalkalibacter akibai (strain ATCC 43226 / DSM 21942 / CIP 109018 / JCM 9157 / 1139) TaxID=1236973 RepID=W4QZN1_HALA3|nr:TRAP transporter small permease [Halalkalibacter akibai]GAE37362.1 TRAP-type transport system [Halalkalibacter akibai JCM 9157]